MTKPEAGYPADWFRIGARDLDRARRLLDDDDYPGAAFNIQQSVEKYLKGWLITRGWRLRRVHDVEVLLNDAVEHNSGLEEFREQCRKITQYYFEDRYPNIVASELTRDEVAESLAAAERLISRIQA